MMLTWNEMRYPMTFWLVPNFSFIKREKFDLYTSEEKLRKKRIRKTSQKIFHSISFMKVNDWLSPPFLDAFLMLLPWSATFSGMNAKHSTVDNERYILRLNNNVRQTFIKKMSLYQTCHLLSLILTDAIHVCMNTEKLKLFCHAIT